MAKLYIIAGCNGAGKTTAAYEVLPMHLGIKEFINADEIARGVSPFQSEKVAFVAGKIMLSRIKELMNREESFAFETTLASKTFIHLIDKARSLNYEVNLLFFWLNCVDLAVERVSVRVKEGGHNIPKVIIRRRYERGLKNFFGLYQNKVDSWKFVDNSEKHHKVVAQRIKGKETIFDRLLWSDIIDNYERDHF